LLLNKEEQIVYVKKEIREFIEKMPKKEKLTREWKKFIQESTIKHNLLIEHGKEEYERAEKLAQSLFNNKFEDLTKQDIADLFDEQDMKEVNVDISIVDIVISVGAASSKREAREFITNGAISINGEKVDSIETLINDDMFIDNTYIIVKLCKTQVWKMSS